MAIKPDPWQPLGTFLYHAVQFFLKTTGLPELHKGAPMSTEYSEDPEPRWQWCHGCQVNTVWDAYCWVLDGDTDYECSQCGAVG